MLINLKARFSSEQTKYKNSVNIKSHLIVLFSSDVIDHQDFLSNHYALIASTLIPHEAKATYRKALLSVDLPCLLYIKLTVNAYIDLIITQTMFRVLSFYRTHSVL